MRLLRPLSLRGRVTWAVLALQAVILVVLFTAVDLALAARLVALEVVGGLLALLLAGPASARVSRAALRPPEDMTAPAGRIAAGDRGRRLGHPRTDSELRRTAAAFDAMLDELEAALATANAAEAGMRSFLADASHELRAPMAGLQANAELLLREELDRAERERVAVAMVRETRRAARLVDDLLTTARLGQGGLTLATARVDLVRLAEAETARARTLAPGLTFAVRAGPAPPVLGDPVRLGQILTNLLDNARHATPAGGTVTVSVRHSADRVVLEVADTGPGVPAADRALIFERFGRGDGSRDTGGAGLGLPIARGLAVAHGGSLEYADSPAGALFRVDLPAAT